jgi:very-short-patch-repair endonuclease
MNSRGDFISGSSPLKGRTGGVRPQAKDIFNTAKSKSRRKKLRAGATFTEQRIWFELRGKRMQGYKFRRQFGIGKYIVDFYASQLNLVIEIDGDTHAGARAEQYDRCRTEYLNSLGIECIRFTNHEVMQNFDGVLVTIWNKIEKIKAGWTNPSQPSP